MTEALDLSAEDRRLVWAILTAHLPATAKIWVFGSRASGRARRYSDLDLAIDGGFRKIIAKARVKLTETDAA